jgi:hypothetical protein
VWRGQTVRAAGSGGRPGFDLTLWKEFTNRRRSYAKQKKKEGRKHVENWKWNVWVCSLFGWLVADGWCWFVLREEYCWLVAGGWFVVREKYCWLMADKPSEQGVGRRTRGRNSAACSRRSKRMHGMDGGQVVCSPPLRPDSDRRGVRLPALVASEQSASISSRAVCRRRMGRQGTSPCDGSRARHRAITMEVSDV